MKISSYLRERKTAVTHFQSFTFCQIDTPCSKILPITLKPSVIKMWNFADHLLGYRKKSRRIFKTLSTLVFIKILPKVEN